jgi:hypothetical protein
MTIEDLQLIKNRYEATSVAPWVSFIEGRDHESGSSFVMTGIPVGEISGATNADLDFIAHARQDIPALIAEIERLKKLLANAK